MSAHTARSATCSVISVVILAVAMAAIAVPGDAVSSPVPVGRDARSAARTTNAAPSVQAEGHLHTVVPRVVVSTAHGVGVKKGVLPTNGHREVLFAGRGGLPRTGIRAVALNIAVTGTRSPTLYVGSSKTRPGVPVVRSQASAASNFAVVALDATGHLGLWGGPAPEQVTIEVTGWFASGSEAGTAGLFNALAGRQVRSVTLAAGKSVAIPVAGKAGVPASGASAVLARFRTAGAGASGTLLAGSSGTALGPALLYRKGANVDIGLVALRHGSLVLHNKARKRVTVGLDVVGWFTSGAKGATGDALHLGSGFLALHAAHVAAAGRSASLTGRGDVPDQAGGVTTSVVLAQTVITAPSASGSLAAAPTGGAASRQPVATYAKAHSASGLVAVEPGQGGRATWQTSGPRVSLTVRPYAYFAGGTVVAPNVTPVTSQDAGSVTAISTDSITFHGVPADLANLSAGKILAAPITSATPDGFLREVTSTTTTNGNLVVSTAHVAMDQVIEQGSFSVGDGATAQVPHAHTPTRGARAAAVNAPTCSRTASLASLSIELACSWQQDLPGLKLAANANAGLAMTIDGSFSLVSGAHVVARATASASVSATADAEQPGTVSKNFSLGVYRLPEITIWIGDVPIVLFPVLLPQIQVDATYQLGMHGDGGLDASYTVTSDSDTGISTSHSLSKHGSGTYNGDAHGDVRVTLLGALSTYIDNEPAPNLKNDCDWATGKRPDGKPCSPAAVTVVVAPSVDLAVDQCSLRVLIGLKFIVNVQLSLFGQSLVDLSKTISLPDVLAYVLNLSNCAIWSGTVQSKSEMHTTDGGSAGSQFDGHGKSLATLGPSAYASADDTYPVSISGSGVEVDQIAQDCNGPYTRVIDINWAGAEDDNGTAITWRIEVPDPDHPHKYQIIASADYVTSDVTVKDTNEDPGAGCEVTTTTTDHPNYNEQNMFTLFNPDNSQVGAVAHFTLPSGSTTVHQTINLRADPTHGNYGYTLTFALTKTCSEGGSSC